MGREQYEDKQQPTSTEQEIAQPGPRNEGEGVERSLETANEAAMGQLDADAPAPKDPERKLDPVIAGDRIPVSTTEIDRELVQIWKATTAREGEDRSSVSLLRALNLIVYVDSAERAEQVDDVISQVTGRHPSRTLLLVKRPGEAEDIAAWISAHCQLPETSNRYICSEQVSIAATGRAIERLPNIALNLLVTDLPVFLWWYTGSRLEGYVADHLVASADRVVIDSALWQEPIDNLLALAESENGADATRYALSDFNWGRLSIWRESTAQFFDAPSRRAYLNRLALVRVDYVDGGDGAANNPIQALLYAGWLAGRLGWSIQRGQPERGHTQGKDLIFWFARDGRQIQVVLRPVQPTEEISAGITAVRLDTGGADRGTYEIRLQSDTCTTTIVDTKTGEPVRRTRGFMPSTDASLLNQELEIFGRDSIYDDALQVAAQLILANPAMRDRAAYDAEQERTGRRRVIDPRF
ncbi:MAG TPA: glucose-6-phosphate dehydrogenase assembly protein OpcA [Ardenticatenaceae bacterium]|nr:glucose-6-phosphate dehydrogenase assembly protein OpcA [Ardenticatenaceae bacterium]